MIKSFLAYVTCFLSFTLLSSFIRGFVSGFIADINSGKYRIPVFLLGFIKNLISLSISLYFLLFLFGIISVEITILMFVIPFIFEVTKQFKQILSVIREGEKAQKSLNGDENKRAEYIQGGMEIGYLFGNVAGLAFVIAFAGPFPWY